MPAGSDAVAFVNVSLWDGTGAPVRNDSTLVIADGRIVSASSAQAPAGAAIVDLDGAFVMPGLINTHGHVTANWAPASLTDPVDRVRAGLVLYARYGVTTVLSLGGAPDAGFALRDRFDPAEPGHARFYLAGPVVAQESAVAARAQAEANVSRGVDWLKLRVDDNLGRTVKMPWDAVQAVIDVGNESGVPVATHLFYLADAMRLLDMGSGMIAHSVRDVAIERTFVDALDEAGVCYVPTLTREVSTFVYAETPDFFADDFFRRYASEEQMARVTNAEFQQNMANSEIAAGYRLALVQAMENLHTAATAGAKIALGTDSGPPGRFPGYFEHLELEMMVDAGMTPEDALRSATGIAAECAGLSDVGTLTPGKWADFLIMAEDPTRNITATKTLQRVFLAGRELR
ncbi:MAG: amidohydrolase family protein [Pseudomonadota bacterium]